MDEHCTCLNGENEVTTSVHGCLVHATIKQFISEEFEMKYFSCKYCDMLMAGVREDSFYKGKWYDKVYCDNPDCRGSSKHICKWWLDENHELKQEFIDKEIQRRKDNNLPMGKEGDGNG